MLGSGVIVLLYWPWRRADAVACTRLRRTRTGLENHITLWTVRALQTAEREPERLLRQLSQDAWGQ